MFVRKVFFWLIICLSGFVGALRKGEKCVTQNGEEATCVRVGSCAVIIEGFNKKLPDIKDFAKNSVCGEDDDKHPLVCCGSLARIATPCDTPNGEAARCLPLTGCKIISKSLATRTPQAATFARKSQCGFENNDPMVCCGSEAYLIKSNLLPNRKVCGNQKADDRVFGGETTDLLEFPWMALLRFKNSDGSDAGFRCGGTVINNRYVLTAAHCAKPKQNLGISLDIVRLGEWKISSDLDCDESQIETCTQPVIDLTVEKKIVHPNYNRSTGVHDIALLRLERSIEYSDSIRPICLPVAEAPEPRVGRYMYVSGWGATEKVSYADIKMKVKLPIASRRLCSRKLSNRGPITTDHICAGGEPGKDSCQGDSGGPLMGTLTEDLIGKPIWYQEGIVSRGLDCGITGFPGVYIRVAKYMNWIIDNLESF